MQGARALEHILTKRARVFPFFFNVRERFLFLLVFISFLHPMLSHYLIVAFYSATDFVLLHVVVGFLLRWSSPRNRQKKHLELI